MSQFTMYASDFIDAFVYTVSTPLSNAKLSFDTKPGLIRVLDLVKEKDTDSAVKLLTQIVVDMPVNCGTDIIVDVLILYNYILLQVSDSESIEIQQLHDAITNNDKDFI